MSRALPPKAKHFASQIIILAILALVSFVLVWRLTGSGLAAALLTAVVFSISHSLQGWKSMAIIFGFAIAFQGIAWISGSLYIGMAVHALYDIAAGFCYGAFGEESNYPIEPLPA